VRRREEYLSLYRDSSSGRFEESELSREDKSITTDVDREIRDGYLHSKLNPDTYCVTTLRGRATLRRLEFEICRVEAYCVDLWFRGVSESWLHGTPARAE
jgi:hypothetical protein